MPRQARIILTSYLHHVTQRGNNKQNIFHDDQDRIVYLKYMNKYCQKYHVLIYAFCLMKNHVHFILKPQEIHSLARAISVTHQRYSYYHNIKNKKYGHLWQERFFSCPLHGQHIPQAIKYVEMNPVRAGILPYAWTYTWSSAAAHMGKEYKIIELADIREYVSIRGWKNFLMKKESDDDLKMIRKCTQYGQMAGPIELVKQLEDKLKIKLLRKPKGRPKK